MVEVRKIPQFFVIKAKSIRYGLRKLRGPHDISTEILKPGGKEWNSLHLLMRYLKKGSSKSKEAAHLAFSQTKFGIVGVRFVRKSN